jgi:CheY-like chemotaxis protein/nitrogen-specific signal transduction histidine kinase/HPt (histidine-containing phosphotransfer) domain-containing protein
MEAVARDMEESLTKAEAANKAKGDFLSNMSHELRTPMNGVLGMASLLAETPLNDEQKEFVSTINSSGESLLMLLNDILDFSKIEAGALVLEHIAFNFTEALHKTTSLLRSQAEKKGIDLRLDCEANVPPYMWGASGRIRQIIMNLLSNAIKFTERGYVRVSVRLQEIDGGDRLYVTVEDTGTGIPSDKLGTIFEKFTQADSTITRKYGGTGLGLTITKQLVELMGGEMGVESAEGKGSSFWFTIPYKPAQAIDIRVQSVERTMRCQAVETLHPIGDAKVLLVEDYHVNLVFAEKLLRKFGFKHIDTAENGVQAIEKYRTNTYDMIFMDCQMPELDGYQATQKLRLLEEGTPVHTPIVAMTANAMMGDREKCLKAGMDDYLSKPLRAEHLKHILQTWFVLDEGKATISALKSDAPALKEVEEAPVDMEQLRMFTDGDLTEEKALSTLFLDQAQEMISLLQQSTSEDKHAVWKSAAHRFKGSSGNLGAMKLHHLCMHAETHFKDSEAKKLEMLIAIKDETKRVELFFSSL